jgi:phenylacetate-coenzyme A ligase PaaK-like adenylate-forming protein
MKLDMSTYEPFGLEAIETASRDEIAALQTRRIKRTLEIVYENVPACRKKFDGAGVTQAVGRLIEVSVHDQAGSARELSFRDVCRSQGPDRAGTRLLRHDG